jgi:hypothetical protein
MAERLAVSDWRKPLDRPDIRDVQRQVVVTTLRSNYRHKSRKNVTECERLQKPVALLKY